MLPPKVLYYSYLPVRYEYAIHPGYYEYISIISTLYEKRCIICYQASFPHRNRRYEYYVRVQVQGIGIQEATPHLQTSIGSRSYTTLTFARVHGPQTKSPHSGHYKLFCYHGPHVQKRKNARSLLLSDTLSFCHTTVRSCGS
jgi:hypothetical protein